MRSLRPLSLAATVAVALSSGACTTSLSGLGGTSSYSCPLPQGGHCKPISQVYEDSLEPGFGDASRAASKADQDAEAAVAPVATATPVSPSAATAPPAPAYRAPAAVPEGNGFTIPGLPAALLTRPRVLRVYIAPWADNDDTLLEGRRAYVKLDEGRWRLDHFRKAEQKAFAPIQPPPAVPAAPLSEVRKGADAIAQSLGNSPFMPAAVADRLRESQERMQ